MPYDGNVSPQITRSHWLTLFQVEVRTLWVHLTLKAGFVCYIWPCTCEEKLVFVAMRVDIRRGGEGLCLFSDTPMKNARINQRCATKAF
jgi:hypothetical protein